MIKVGDRVNFLNDKISGVVINIKDGRIAIIETEDGFELPHPIDQLVALKDNGFRIDENELLVNYEKRESKIKLVLLPEFEILEDSSCYNLWVINDTENLFIGVVSRDHKGLREYIVDFRISGFEKKMIFSVSKKEIKFINYLFIDGFLFTRTLFLPDNRVDFSVNLKRNNLEDELSFSYQDAFSKIGIDYLVYDERAKNQKLVEQRTGISFLEKDIIDVERQQRISKLNHKNLNGKDEKEIDLHIEALIENYSEMGKIEILEYQLYIMRTELEKAISLRFKKVIFIHGIGNGRLKFEIIKCLKTYKKIEYQDASYQKYGFGATEVLIK